MIEGRPSATAELVAVRRAVHQLLDRPLVFEDPLALAIVGGVRETEIRADPFRAGGGALGTALRAHLVVRSRVAEEQLAAAVARGVRQYVVLGAGLDTFICRNPHPHLRVFEVDFPGPARVLLVARRHDVPRAGHDTADRRGAGAACRRRRRARLSTRARGVGSVRRLQRGGRPVVR